MKNDYCKTGSIELYVVYIHSNTNLPDVSRCLERDAVDLPVSLPFNRPGLATASSAMNEADSMSAKPGSSAWRAVASRETSHITYQHYTISTLTITR